MVWWFTNHNNTIFGAKAVKSKEQIRCCYPDNVQTCIVLLAPKRSSSTTATGVVSSAAATSEVQKST